MNRALATARGRRKPKKQNWPGIAPLPSRAWRGAMATTIRALATARGRRKPQEKMARDCPGAQPGRARSNDHYLRLAALIFCSPCGGVGFLLALRRRSPKSLRADPRTLQQGHNLRNCRSTSSSSLLVPKTAPSISQILKWPQNIKNCDNCRRQKTLTENRSSPLAWHGSYRQLRRT